MVIGKNTRAKVEIPPYLRVFEMKEFWIECSELNDEGKPIKNACPDFEAFID